MKRFTGFIICFIFICGFLVTTSSPACEAGLLDTIEQEIKLLTFEAKLIAKEETLKEMGYSKEERTAIFEKKQSIIRKCNELTDEKRVLTESQKLAKAKLTDILNRLESAKEKLVLTNDFEPLRSVIEEMRAINLELVESDSLLALTGMTEEQIAAFKQNWEKSRELYVTLSKDDPTSISINSLNSNLYKCLQLLDTTLLNEIKQDVIQEFNLTYEELQKLLSNT